MDQMAAALAKRSGKPNLSTARREQDNVIFLSGVVDGITTGTPICLILQNGDVNSSAYHKERLRPSHADYVAEVKYGGHQDYRGGGHFSGRVTAALVAAGSIAAQILAAKGVIIGSHLRQIHTEKDADFALHKQDIMAQLQAMNSREFPVLDSAAAEKMQAAIAAAKADGDSVGGVVETAILGVPAGVGEPWFDGLESLLAQYVFAVPGVKGVSFGGGFDMCQKYGSEVNDALAFDHEGQVITTTNNSGGIAGGIANGMPIIMQTAIKPTPSIYKPQQSIDLQSRKEVQIKIEGRHDPAIVYRALPVIDSVAALAVLDSICAVHGTAWQVEK